jgi:hypothetical protein
MEMMAERGLSVALTTTMCGVDQYDSDLSVAGIGSLGRSGVRGTPTRLT